MGLFEKYSCLYGDTAFTPDEQAEIGRFVAGMVKAAAEGNRVELNNVYERHFAYATDDTLKKIGRVLYYFSRYGDDAVKVAAEKHFVREAMPVVEKAAELVKKAGIGDVFSAIVKGVGAVGRSAAGTINPLLGGMALLSVSVPVVKAGIDAIRQSGQLRGSLKSILQQHPEMRNDPNTEQYFHLLTTFAPSIAANPLMAGQMLKRFHEAGPSLFSNTETIRNLVGIEGTVAQTGKPAQDQINTMAATMMNLGTMLAKQEELGMKHEELGMKREEAGTHKEEFAISQGLRSLSEERQTAEREEERRSHGLAEFAKQHAATAKQVSEQQGRAEKERIDRIKAMLGQAGKRP